MKIAAAYIRVSTEDQIEYSPDSQLSHIRNYAKKNNMILPEEFIFIDEGISGKSTKKRDKFNKMIGIAKQKPKPFDVILVWKFSRFARSRQDSVVYKTMLRKQLGIEVTSISESLGDDKTSILIEALIEAMDEYYSINLAEEVKRGMTEKVHRGQPVSIPAFGYDIKDKKYILNEDESPIIKQLFEDFAEGAGYRQLANKLNMLNIRTKRGNKFENRTIEYILNNPVYIGKIRWNPTGKTYRDFKNPNIVIIDGDHEPLIGNELWESVQRRVQEVKIMYQKHARTVNPKTPFMLQGLVRCSNCGSTLTMSSHNKSLQCCGYTHGKCDVSHSITVSKLNNLVLNVIENMLKTGIFELKKHTINNNSCEKELRIKAIQKEKIKLQRVKEAYENGIDTLDEYRDNKLAILKRIEELENIVPKEIKKESKEDFIIKHLNTIKLLRDENITEAEKNETLRSFVEYIVFDRTSQNIEVYLYI